MKTTVEINNNHVELNDEKLKDVAGGSFYSLKFYKTPEEVQFVHKIGDTVEIKTIFGIGTVRCRITDVKADYFELNNSGFPGIPGSTNFAWGYIDLYFCEELESHWHFRNEWKRRSEIEL